MTGGRFDTDAGALGRRIDAHGRYAERPLEPWLLGLLDPAFGAACLELGCGTGKQTIPLAAAVGESGSVLAVDVSAEALAELADRARAAGPVAPINILRADFDELAAAGCKRRFDRVVSSYALYYSRAPEALISAIGGAIAPGGILCACGPGKGNNDELLRFLATLGAEPAVSGPIELMEEVAPDLIEDSVGPVERHRLENPLRFGSAAALHSYWSSHNSFDPALDGAFRSAAEQHFRCEAEFVTTKRVLALRARAPGEREDAGGKGREV